MLCYILTDRAFLGHSKLKKALQYYLCIFNQITIFKIFDGASDSLTLVQSFGLPFFKIFTRPWPHITITRFSHFVLLTLLLSIINLKTLSKSKCPWNFCEVIRLDLEPNCQHQIQYINKQNSFACFIFEFFEINFHLSFFFRQFFALTFSGIHGLFDLTGPGVCGSLALNTQITSFLIQNFIPKVIFD